VLESHEYESMNIRNHWDYDYVINKIQMMTCEEYVRVFKQSTPLMR